LTNDELTAVLGGWEGYRLLGVRRVEVDPEYSEAHPVIEIDMEPCADRVKRCSGCLQPVDQVHDVTVRRIRDLNILDARTVLIVPRCRLNCPRCGPKLEQLDWLARYARVTRRLALSVARLCAVLPIKHVAAYLGLDWGTVKRIDQDHLEETLGPVDLGNVESIVMDEFAIQKGHRYATVILESTTKRVLWVCRGRTREDIRPFFEKLGADGRRRLRAVAIDMNSAYEEEVRYQCPLTDIVYDLFHVVAKYGREVVDRVRVDEANRLRHDKSARKVVKGARWLLLKNRENIEKHDDRVRLNELLSANKHLATVYILKDDLKQLWGYRYEGAALRFWRQWYDRAVRSRIEPLKRFARNLKERIRGVLAHCHWPLHTSLLEGVNNRIKVIKRMAYGFRDDTYFFLKIRAAFPGNSG
jgi:transposase